MPINKATSSKDPYESAFTKARDIRLKQSKRIARPKIVIVPSNSKASQNTSPH